VNLCVLTIRDGRDDVHERSLASLREHLPEPEHHVVVDDREHELGFAGAIQFGWERVRETGAEWVFHHEADFIFNAPVPVDRMVAVLKRQPSLVQLVLKRQPWNAAEQAAGGIVEQPSWRDDFHQRVEHGNIWTEHRRFFSTNPCVYPAALCAQGWPQVPQSEGMFTHRLLEDPDVRFAFWGAKFDPPLVEHVGATRAGHGY
jgi:hypothetical protein